MKFYRKVNIKCPYCGAELVISPSLKEMRDGVPSLCRCESDDVQTCGRWFVITISLKPVIQIARIEDEEAA